MIKYIQRLQLIVEVNSWIPYFSDHRISKPNPNPDNSPDHDCSHLLVRDAVGRKGGHQIHDLEVARERGIKRETLRIEINTGMDLG